MTNRDGFGQKMAQRLRARQSFDAPHMWLANVHRELDAAVAEAYGWRDYSEGMSDEEILGRLLKLNLERSSQPTS